MGKVEELRLRKVGKVKGGKRGRDKGGERGVLWVGKIEMFKGGRKGGRVKGGKKGRGNAVKWGNSYKDGKKC